VNGKDDGSKKKWGRGDEYPVERNSTCFGEKKVGPKGENFSKLGRKRTKGLAEVNLHHDPMQLTRKKEGQKKEGTKAKDDGQRI